jgi:hypothetical protein
MMYRIVCGFGLDLTATLLLGVLNSIGLVDLQGTVPTRVCVETRAELARQPVL